MVITVADLCLRSVGFDECKSISSRYGEAQNIKATINEKMANYGISAAVRIEAGNEAESMGGSGILLLRTSLEVSIEVCSSCQPWAAVQCRSQSTGLHREARNPSSTC